MKFRSLTGCDPSISCKTGVSSLIVILCFEGNFCSQNRLSRIFKISSFEVWELLTRSCKCGENSKMSSKNQTFYFQCRKDHKNFWFCQANLETLNLRVCLFLEVWLHYSAQSIHFDSQIVCNLSRHLKREIHLIKSFQNQTLHFRQFGSNYLNFHGIWSTYQRQTLANFYWILQNLAFLALLWW